MNAVPRKSRMFGWLALASRCVSSTICALGIAEQQEVCFSIRQDGAADFVDQ